MPLFDIFSTPTPKLILSAFNGHYFLAPDNGILPLALGDDNISSWVCFEMQPSNDFNDWLQNAGKMAHLLDENSPDTMGLKLHKLYSPPKTQQSEPDTISCEIIHIDKFDNVVLDFTRREYELLANGRQFNLAFIKTETIAEISKNYTDVKEGHKLCRFNSNGHLEICINHGRAASLFGMRLGGKHNNIKIIYT